MNRYIPLLAFLLLTGLVQAAQAQYDQLPAENAFRTEERRYGHLEYFGFYASAMGPWNFTETLAPFTNLTWIHLGSADAPEEAIAGFIDRIREARDSGVQAVLSIEPFLFLNPAGDPRPDEEIEDILVELRARLEFEDLLEAVAMIYPKDEPFREFVKHRDPNFIEEYVTGEVYEEIHACLLYTSDAADDRPRV